MSNTPLFPSPPVVELVLGAQFAPLSKLTAGHFGLFWKELGEDWVTPSDAPTLDDQFELFDRPRPMINVGMQLRFEPIVQPNRFKVEHRGEDRLIQIQSTRFHYNWQKRSARYPGYELIVQEFEEKLKRFEQFSKANGLGELLINQWELIYVDTFPRSKYWTELSEFSKFLPGIFGELFSVEGLQLENRGAEWSFEIMPKLGRLHISARPGLWGEAKEEALILQMTARGPVGKGGVTCLREGLDKGHHVVGDAFAKIVAQEARQTWGDAK